MQSLWGIKRTIKLRLMIGHGKRCYHFYTQLRTKNILFCIGLESFYFEKQAMVKNSGLFFLT